MIFLNRNKYIPEIIEKLNRPITIVKENKCIKTKPIDC
jgi:hypothetical protein